MKRNIGYIVLIILTVVFYSVIFSCLHKIVPVYLIASSFIIFSCYIFFLNSSIFKYRIKAEKAVKKIASLNKISDELLNISSIYFENSFKIQDSINKNVPDADKKCGEFQKLFKSFNEYYSTLKPDEKQNQLDKADSLLSGIRSFIDQVVPLEGALFDDLRERVCDSIKKEEFRNKAAEYEYYSEIIFEFINSVIVNMNETSKPLTEQIFIIKQNIHNFLTNLLSWKQDLSDESSRKNFNNIIKKYNEQNFEFKLVSEIIGTSHKNLEGSLINLVRMIEKIYENSFQIQDISEKIKLLSVNASIESSKAGSSGKGFRVIADEIKKLSETTQLFINDILGLISDGKETAQKSMDTFSTEVKSVTLKLDHQKEAFEQFYKTLNNYYKDFVSIFSFISGLTNEISLHINKFNPIFQSHDISVQALENVRIMNKKFLSDNKDEMISILNSINDCRKNEILAKILNLVEDKITTDSEIEVLNRVSQVYNMKRNIKVNNRNEIELF